jgi:hypothetical protein
MSDGTWMSYPEAAQWLGISREAVRRRADRGNWGRTKGNDGFTRVCVPENAARMPSGTRAADGRADASALVSALESHITSLKAEIETLKVEQSASRTRADEMTAEHGAETERLRAELASERERGGEKLAAMEDRLAQRDEQLAAARSAADKATAELVALAQRLAAIAEERSELSHPGRPNSEPHRRSAMGRAWAWFLRN